MHRLLTTILLPVVCIAGTGRTGGAQARPGGDRPEVLIVATGGTIASTNYYSGNSQKIGIAQVLDAVPALDSVARVSTQQFANVASTSVSPEMLIQLSRSISDTLRARPGLAGVVVTHGTDALEETAYFLDLTIADPRPVVVTGAMRPADGIGIDGPANLYSSVRIAGDPAARDRGAMVVMNDQILAARDATKANTTRPDAFVSTRGSLGRADPEQIVFYAPPHRQPTFDLTGVTELPRVDIVYTYLGADGAAVDALVAAGAKGIIVAGSGRGATPPLEGQALRRAAEQGVIVVTGSRTGSGGVPVGTGTGRNRVGAGDLNVQKARLLLSLALTRTSDPAEIARIFREHQ